MWQSPPATYVANNNIIARATFAQCELFYDMSHDILLYFLKKSIYFNKEKYNTKKRFLYLIFCYLHEASGDCTTCPVSLEIP